MTKCYEQGIYRKRSKEHYLQMPVLNVKNLGISRKKQPNTELIEQKEVAAKCEEQGMNLWVNNMVHNSDFVNVLLYFFLKKCLFKNDSGFLNFLRNLHWHYKHKQFIKWIPFIDTFFYLTMSNSLISCLLLYPILYHLLIQSCLHWFHKQQSSFNVLSVCNFLV